MQWLLALTLLAQTNTGEFDFRYVLDEGERNGAYFVTAYLEIPYSTLQFVRKDSALVSRYHVVLQLIDRKKNLYGDERFGEVEVDNIEVTRSYSATKRETLTVTLPAGNYDGNVTVRMLAATRKVNKKFQAALFPRALGNVILTDQRGDFRLSRPFDSSDTLAAKVSLYEEGIDSLALRITRSDAPSFKNTVTSPAKEVSWKIPLENFTSGSYELQVRAYRQGKEIDMQKSTFLLRVPFQLDLARYYELVDKLVYIATAQERDKMKSVQPEERQVAWDSFWRAKDPTPQTAYNEVMEEYFVKIDYCEQAFGHGDKGYLSDRAKVYMKLGPPDEIEDHPFESNRYPYIIWTYQSIGTQFIFEDRLGFGEYELVSPQGFF